MRGFGTFLARKLIGITREAGGVKVYDFEEQTQRTKKKLNSDESYKLNFCKRFCLLNTMELLKLYYFYLEYVKCHQNFIN